MSIFEPSPSPWTDRMLSVYRIVAGLLFISFGTMKVLAVAYFQFHVPISVFPTTSNGVPAVMYCFFFLYLVFAGAGPWSLDAVLVRSRRGIVGP